jgi:multidrug efflux pump
MGVAVFFGMLGVTLFGLFLTPVFYVLLRKLGRGTLHSAARHDAPVHAHNPVPATQADH